ncbi:uncharacterized protein BDW70DRAFT_115074 [Aspergillus foveolatus]|uniref:uncharacterized protein n=1 Tax=Aspergillus foveolatus TaxID=210207 RepID=UPI003CCE4809
MLGSTVRLPPTRHWHRLLGHCDMAYWHGQGRTKSRVSNRKFTKIIRTGMQCTDIPTALRSVPSIRRSLICASTAAVTVAFPGFWLTVMPGG